MAHKCSVPLHPNSGLTLVRLGYAHVQASTQPVDTEPAVGYFQRTMRLSQLDPEIDWMLAGIAMAHNQAKRFAKALPYAERAVEEDAKQCLRASSTDLRAW